MGGDNIILGLEAVLGSNIINEALQGVLVTAASQAHRGSFFWAMRLNVRQPCSSDYDLVWGGGGQKCPFDSLLLLTPNP